MQTDVLFQLPPQPLNARGEMRKAGFEMEFAGLDIDQSARIVQSVFGGTHVVESTFIHRVDTTLGTFGVEIDASLLKDKRYQSLLDTFGIKLDIEDSLRLETILLDVASTLVPIEIGSPPLPVDSLSPLEELRKRLHEAKAKGTRAALLYAFGMHINPEIPSDDPGVLRDFIRAFILLSPWLTQCSEVDIARRVTPYINPFPPEYARLILQPDYPASKDRLIDDYLQHNATRNRALDMLPVLSFLDQHRVLRQVDDPHLVKPRPAFHFRLPNCMIDESHWSLAGEWNRWVAVERLASEPGRLAAMSQDYLLADEASFRPFIDKWPGVLEKYVGRNDE